MTLTTVPASVVPLIGTEPALALLTYIGAVMVSAGATVSLKSEAVAAVLVLPAASLTVAV
ncbi:hypothetical protein [Arthrobacter nitrophenolicus]|uniref:hypothetical protein n=1 Tax=Arthrobacter nitrophenolicus TaxID=683150 RepID=UPI001F1165FD|nr:hypothetical protein [Arthrobacter nitrophenolicus]